MPSLTTRQLPGKSGRKSGSSGQLEPGTVLQQRYQIVGILGVGGMGSVYQARDLRFPEVTRLCAVKEMLNLATDPQLRKTIVKNFEREANILATLNHPAVPEIFDYFTEDNRSFLVMEFVTGRTIEEILGESSVLLEEEVVLDWAVQICDVLAYLHSHKPTPIIFRDIKPSNIMLDLHERIRMIDFGIAKNFQSGERGTMIGTEGYSPPEQYRGEATPSSDVYSFGATLHAILTKQDPRLEPPFSFADRPIRSVNPDVSPGFEAVINRSLAYNVDERFPTAMEMAEAFNSLQARAVPTAARPGARTSSRTAHLVTAYRISPDNVLPLWTFKCEDEIRSSPHITQNKVLVGAYDNNLYAVNVENGEFIWKYPTGGGIASSPCTADNRAFVGSEDQKLHAVFLDLGQPAWTFETRGRIYSSPLVDFGHVFVGSDDTHFYAVSAATGREAWRAELGARVRSSPRSGGELIYVGGEDGTIHALALDGNTKWRFSTKRAVTSSPALAEGLVIVGSQDWAVYAIDAATGWSAWRFRTKAPVVSSPSVYQEVVYVGSADGLLYAIDLYSGMRKWTFEVGGQITSSPLVHQDAVYLGSIDGSVYSVDTQSGELRWRFQSEGPVPGSAAAHEDIVIIGSTDGRLYALPA